MEVERGGRRREGRRERDGGREGNEGGSVYPLLLSRPCVRGAVG